MGRPQWLLPAGIGLLIAVLVIVAIVRDPVELDPSTPEGVVQEYLQAIGDNDFDRALETLHPDEFTDCVSADISRHAPNEPFTASLDSDSETPRTDGQVAVVSVRLRIGTDGMFGSSYETFENFELVFADGAWRITGEPWPYFAFACSERGDQ